MIMRNSVISKKKNWDKWNRIDLGFNNEIDDVIRKRIMLGKENPRKPNGIRRATKAIIRLSYWGKIKEDLINAEWKEDRWKNLK